MIGPLPHRLLCLTLVLLLTISCWGRELEGVWLSPDWFFPGTRKYSEAEVRSVARDTLEALAERGITDVFLETFLRGYAIAPGIKREAYKAKIVPYVPRTSGIPVYPHLTWNYKIEADTVVDPLTIFIEEGELANVRIHAWVHAFYWRMDNSDVMLRWHNGPQSLERTDGGLSPHPGGPTSG